tara:strand:+ start:1844 stop:2926 length:1083 start_codon:yes stop_codon:yes gene_type:complete
MPLSKILPSGVSQPTPVNAIINGNMSVAQRGTSETGVGASAGYFTVDRWRLDTGATTAGRLTMSQDSSAPSGFANSLKLACTTADTSIAAGEMLIFQGKLEGQNLQAFAKGTSDAKPFALSFYVKGNASATYVAGLYDNDNNRYVASTFSVTTDWTRVEITFPADTTGALDNNNASSLELWIWLHCGSTYKGGTLPSTWASYSNSNAAEGGDSFFDSTNRTFFITGVQLTAGSEHHEFIHESYAETLYKCERYYQQLGGYTDAYTRLSAPTVVGNTQANWTFPFKTIMRATPSLTATAANWILTNGSASKTLTSLGLTRSDVTQAFLVMQWSGTEFGVGQSVEGYANNDTSYRMQFDSEL